MEDVANILHLFNVENVDPFHYDILPTDVEVYNILKKGAPTLLSKAFWFNEWIKHFWQKSQEPNCKFEAMLCSCLGRFIFCDIKETFHC